MYRLRYRNSHPVMEPSLRGQTSCWGNVMPWMAGDGVGPEPAGADAQNGGHASLACSRGGFLGRSAPWGRPGVPLPCFLAVGSGWCFPRKQPCPPQPQSLEVPASGTGSVVLGVWLPREGRCGSRGVSGLSGGLRQRHMPCTCCRQVTQGTQRAGPPSIPGGSAEGSHESRSSRGLHGGSGHWSGLGSRRLWAPLRAR